MKETICFAIFLGLFCLGAVLIGRGDKEPSYQGKPVTLLIEELAGADYRVCDKASEAIQALGPEAAPFLIRALHTQESQLLKSFVALVQQLPFINLKTMNAALLREKAAEQLGVISEKNEAIVPALIAALNEPDPTVRAEVERALRRSGRGSLPALTRALAHSDPRIREGAAEVLYDFGTSAGVAAAELVRALNDRDEGVRSRAARALGACGARDEASVQALVVALNDSAPPVRAAAADALGKLGPAARPAVPLLSRKLYDLETSVRVACARALWRIDGDTERAVPVLISALRDRSVGWQAPFVLGEIGPKAVEAVPALIEALKHEHVPYPLRTPPSSALALGHIGESAVPQLIDTLSDQQASTRIGASIALGLIGSPAKDAVPALVTLLKDENFGVREAAALSLGAIGEETKELVPALRELARDQDIFVSNAAMAALRKIDPGAASEMGLE